MSRIASRLSIGSILVVCLCAAVPARAAESSGSVALNSAVGISGSLPLGSFAGRWQRVEDPEAETARLAAIDAAVADVPWIMRRIAANVLRKNAVPPDAVEFLWDGRVLRQRVTGTNGEFERAVRVDGALEHHTDARGEPFTSRWTWTSDGLEAHWRQAQAVGWTRYRLDDSSGTMVVEQSIQVTALDGIAPIEHRARFDRTSGLEGAQDPAGAPGVTALRVD